MSVPLSCPSCNTHFTLDAIPADRRATCPRCSDVFPLRGELFEETDRDREEAGEQLPQNSKLETRNSKPKSGLSIPRAAFVALSLALIGVVTGYVVYYTRTKPNLTQPDARNTANVLPPAQLAALGYLPAECNVVFAVQPGPVVAYAERTKQDPREVLKQTGLPRQFLTALDQLGVTLLQVDHIASGLFIGDADLRLAFVLVLKQPFTDEDDVLKRLNAKPGKNGRHDVELAKLPLTLAQVSPTVWVFGLNDQDFSAVEKGGFGPGGTQFRGSDSEGMRKMIASVPADASVWVAADDESDWTQKPLMRFMAKSDDARNRLPVVEDARGGLAAASFGEQPRLRLFVRVADAATAERVRTYFQSRAAEMESATAGGGGTYALFDAPFDPATSWNMLQKFVEDAKK